VRFQSRSSELQALSHELTIVKDQNTIQIDESNGRQDEIDALQRHINLITQQNYELSNELQRFLQTDEVVKTKLNRRQTVDEIRHRVDAAVRRSQREVEDRRSPRKPDSTTSTMAQDRMCYRHLNEDRSTSGNARVSASYNPSRTSPLRSKSPPRR